MRIPAASPSASAYTGVILRNGWKHESGFLREGGVHGGVGT